MRIENYFDLGGQCGYSGLFFISGSFGNVDGNVEYNVAEEGRKKIYRYRGKDIELQAIFETVGNVCIRRDSVKNISGQDRICRLKFECMCHSNFYQNSICT